MNKEYFTPRQKEVIAEMCKGKTNKEIARVLGMAEATVKLHLTEIFIKIGVSNRSKAIIKVVDFGIEIPKQVKELTDLEILEEFINFAFDSEEDKFSKKIIMFGRALNKRFRG